MLGIVFLNNHIKSSKSTIVMNLESNDLIKLTTCSPNSQENLFWLINKLHSIDSTNIHQNVLKTKISDSKQNEVTWSLWHWNHAANLAWQE